MADTEPKLSTPTTNPQVTSPTDTMANAPGAVGDSGSLGSSPDDRNSAASAVGVRQHNDRDQQDALRDMPIDANGELTDYDEETPLRDIPSPDSETGESFPGLVDVGEAAASLPEDIDAARRPEPAIDSEELIADLVGSEQTGTGGITDNFEEEIKDESL